MGRETIAQRRKVGPPGSDERIAAVAGRQWGCITTAQLDEAGLDSVAIRRRVVAGRLHRLHRGVYAVGHRGMGNEGRWMAAVLACGPGAALTGFQAARLREMLRGSPGPLEVIAPRSRGGTEGVRVIRVRNLAPQDIGVHRGIPVASVAMILLHLAARGPAAELERALSEAQFRRLYDRRAVEDLLNRSRGRPGAAALRAATEEKALTGTDLEWRMRTLCRRARLPQPVTQLEIEIDGDTHRVDFAWPSHGLIVETDGREGHLTPAAFEADRLRDAQLTTLGWRVVRFTWRQVRARHHVVKTLRTLLA